MVSYKALNTITAIKDSIANSLFKEANEIKQEINLK